MDKKGGKGKGEKRREERDCLGKRSGSSTRKDWNTILALAES